MIFRIVNLLVATFFVLCCIVPDSWGRGPFNPNPPPLQPQELLTLRHIILDAVTFVWFASAIGLFFRSRLAWFGSIFGIGMATYFFVSVLIQMVGVIFVPGTVGGHHTPAEYFVVRLLVGAMLLGFAVACLACWVGFIIGLIKNRTELKWP